jgi:hypothetical protein
LERADGQGREPSSLHNEARSGKSAKSPMRVVNYEVTGECLTLGQTGGLLPHVPSCVESREIGGGSGGFLELHEMSAVFQVLAAERQMAETLFHQANDDLGRVGPCAQ